MTADESGARGAQDTRGLGALTHQSDHDQEDEMDTLPELAEAIDDLRERVRDVANSLSAAYEAADEDDTDTLHLYEAEMTVSGLVRPLVDAREHLATLVGLRALERAADGS